MFTFSNKLKGFMLKVGITGGIGTGKSFVAGIFRVLGIPVYEADRRAKEITEESPGLKKQIIDLLGTQAYTPEGKYNRVFVSRAIFTDARLKQALESLIHPEVRKDGEAWFRRQEEEGHPYCLKEAALLYESGSDRDLDQIIVVDAPLELRIRRLIKRDGLSENEIMNRVNQQWAQEIKKEKADFIIHNDGRHPVIPQVLAIHHQLVRGASVSLG